MIAYAPAPPVPPRPFMVATCKGNNALYLDRERMHDTDHLVDVALKLLSLHGTPGPSAHSFRMPLGHLRLLVCQQLLLATDEEIMNDPDDLSAALKLIDRDQLLPFANVHEGMVLTDAGGMWLHARRRGYEGRPL